MTDPFAAPPSAGERFAEKRTVPRYSRSWQVEIVEPISGTKLVGHTKQVSIKGCGLYSLNALDTGTIVRARISRPPDSIEIWARVTGKLPDAVMGLAFLGTEHQKILAQWIVAET